MGRLDEIHRRSLDDPERFWAEAAAAIDWDEPWERVLDDSGAPFYRWFAGGRMNTCHNALDRHVERGRGDQPELIVSASCGIEPGRLVEYKPLLGAAIDAVEWKPERCIVLQRPMLQAEL